MVPCAGQVEHREKWAKLPSSSSLCPRGHPLTSPMNVSVSLLVRISSFFSVTQQCMSVLWAESCSPKSICWGPNLWELRTWLNCRWVLWRGNYGKIRSHGWALMQYHRCHYKKRRLEHRHTKREDHVKAERRQRSTSPWERPQKKQPCLTLSWTSRWQNSEKINVCCLGHPVCCNLLWQANRTNKTSPSTDSDLQIMSYFLYLLN